MKKKLFIIYILLIINSLNVFSSNKISFTASAPDAVAMGDQFRLSFTINTKDVKDFRAPSIKGFEILMGPNRAYSMQNINGQQSESITYTFILMPTAEGEYTIPGATINTGNEQLTSNSLQIKVLPADNTTNKNNSSNNHSTTKSTSVSNNDLFIRAIVNKTNVYEQEAILLTYKIYTSVDLQRFDHVKLPDFKGFHSQEIELSNNTRWGLEHYKGRNYQTTIFRQFILYPQQSGELTIDAAHFDASVAIVTHSSDPFEAFFNGGSNYIEVKKTIQTPSININVKALPAGKPTDFSSGVGEFKLVSSINKTDIKTNEAVTIKLIISGTGNLKLLSNPQVNYPDNFEIYDPKVDNKFKLTTEGLTGTKTIEYLAIPRDAGNYTIPPISFCYFDINSNSYKKLTTEEYKLNVTGSQNVEVQSISNYTNKEDLRILNQDIRHIKLNNIKLHPKGNLLFSSTAYWLFYIIPTLIFIVFFILHQKKINTNANIAKTRTKKANKVAIKRMKQANILLLANKKDEFYEEILKALWGYISDKLNIHLSSLSKDNVEDKLEKYQVSPTLTKEFIELLNDCEFARFAPGNDYQDTMDRIYTKSLNIISQMENSIKH